MVVLFKKTLTTLVLVSLSIWGVRYGMQWQQVEERGYTYAPRELHDLRHFADAWVDYGRKAWYENQLELAADYFQHGLALNVLDVDAWLDLARVEAEMGRRDIAGEILAFTDRLTHQVVKWKWAQLLLARDLGARDMVVGHINFLIPFRRLQTDALNLLDLHVEGDTGAALEILDARNLPDYLTWLIRLKRPEDSLMVWATLTEDQKQADNLYEKYVNFLVSQKQMPEAVDIWEHFSGHNGPANPGFEAPLSKNAFGWRTSPGKLWDIRQDRISPAEGRYALRISFFGKENVHFRHVRLLTPVRPGVDYRLSFQWRSRDLTTDQRPYIEVRGAQCTSEVWKSDMAPANAEWREASVLFTAPESCRAVSVSLRRRPSRRFNSKIAGRLWLDDFRLTPLEQNQPFIHQEQLNEPQQQQ